MENKLEKKGSVQHSNSLKNNTKLTAAAAAKSLQLCSTLCDPIDGSPPSSPVPEILQARILEWVAISFSNAWKWKVKVKSVSCGQRFATPWTAAYQALPSTGFSRQKYWSGLPLTLQRLKSKFTSNSFLSWSQKVQPSRFLPRSAEKICLAHWDRKVCGLMYVSGVEIRRDVSLPQNSAFFPSPLSYTLLLPLFSSLACPLTSTASPYKRLSWSSLTRSNHPH